MDFNASSQLRPSAQTVYVDCWKPVTPDSDPRATPESCYLPRNRGENPHAQFGCDRKTDAVPT